MEGSLKNDEAAALKLAREVYTVGKSRSEVTSVYDKWAETGDYDKHLNPDRYKGPEYVARALAKHYPADNRPTARILDVAAGTGKLGTQLYELGFRNIDALDPSDGMLNKAKERNIYTNFFKDFIGQETPVPVDDDTYDGLGVSGGFGEGHIPVSALSEMVRIVRPGGIISFAMRDEFFDANGYKGALEPCIQTLEKEEKWRRISREKVPNYVFGKDGLLFVFVVL